MLPAGAPMVKGRAAIEGFVKQITQQLGDFKLTTLDVKPLGADAALEIGTATFKTKAQPPHDGAVKYAVVWQKEDGRWKLLQDIWNSDNSSGRLHLPHRRGISRDDRIGGQQHDAFDDALGDQEPVERVLVQLRQVGNGDGVLSGDRQLAIAVV